MRILPDRWTVGKCRPVLSSNSWVYKLWFNLEVTPSVHLSPHIPYQRWKLKERERERESLPNSSFPKMESNSWVTLRHNATQKKQLLCMNLVCKADYKEEESNTNTRRRLRGRWRSVCRWKGSEMFDQLVPFLWKSSEMFGQLASSITIITTSI
jgi:hypothetical protein